MSSYSYTTTTSNTFTVTHARHISARIATDLARLSQFYAKGPSPERIKEFQEEATEYLKAGYLESVTYGFKKEVTDFWGDKYTKWVLALKYVVKDGELEGGSSSPGGIRPGIDIEGTSFSSYLIPSEKFYKLTQTEREKFKKSLPFSRSAADEPTGNWKQDRSYGQGGKYVDRSITY